MRLIGPLLTPCVLLIIGSLGFAHPLRFTTTTLVIRTDGHFQVDLIADLDALALGVPQTDDNAELVARIEQLSPSERTDLLEKLTQLFQRRVRIRFDGRATPFEVSFPDYGTSRAAETAIPTVIGLTARLGGSVPRDALMVQFFASRAFSTVHLTIVDQGRGITRRAVLERGGTSEPFKLARPSRPCYHRPSDRNAGSVTCFSHQ